MSEKDTGGPAFPYVDDEWLQRGMTLRDYFAAKATEEDIKMFLPITRFEAADLMISLGWIEKGKTEYPQEQWIRLRYWAKYKHADAMLEARK
jgi:hypothetical protein